MLPGCCSAELSLCEYNVCRALLHQADDVASDQLASGIVLFGSDKLEKYPHTHNESIHAYTQQDRVDSTDRYAIS